jgi:AcrR family transcriptional regulator
MGMNKDEKLQITKDNLMEATLHLMENMEDPLKVTSRQIAARAQVQPAMINYCFGSRENLIYATFQKEYLSFLEEDEIKEALNSDLSPKETLKKIHFLVAKCQVRNYKFTKAITGLVLFQRDLGKGSFSFPYVKAHYQGKKTDEECKLIAYELSTMMQLLIYRKDDIRKDFGIDLTDEKVLQKYIDMRVDLLLAE